MTNLSVAGETLLTAGLTRNIEDLHKTIKILGYEDLNSFKHIFDTLNIPVYANNTSRKILIYELNAKRLGYSSLKDLHKTLSLLVPAVYWKY